MSKSLIIAATFAAFSAFLAAPAGAADLPVKAAAPVSVWNWTGFYVGGNVGGGMASSGFTDPCFYCSSATPTGGFFTGGVQAGYNYQFGNGLVGIEADVNGNSGFKKSVIGGGDQTAMTVGANADVSGTIRARGGVVVNNTLFYATGGAAWADVRQTGTDFNNNIHSVNFGVPTGITANASGVVWGGVIGAGFEYALAPHWTFGGEFLHTVYADRDANILFANGTNGCGNFTPRPSTNCVIREQLTTDVARVRLTYRFGDEATQAYAPAAAMYRKAPAAAVYSWTGFYLGGNVGAGMAASAFTDPCFYCSNATPTRGFVTGGAQAGYNYQFGNGLVGIEADVNGNSGFKGSVLGGDDFETAMAVGVKADTSGTIRGRAGVVVNNALVYTTGGVAWADVRQTGVDFFNTGAKLGLPTGMTANASGVLWGGVIGAGVEFAVAPNWTIGGELLHTVYQDRDANIFDPGRNGPNACNSNPATNCVIRSQLTTDVARIRANYRFGGPAGADPSAYAPVTTAYNWTGFYVGGNLGGGMAASRFDDPCFFGGCSSATPTRGFFTGGAQAGYNYQFGRGLVGVEVDVNGNSNFKSSVIGGDDSVAETVGLRADTSGTIRARGGLVVNNALVYATGGLAWADARQTGVQFNNLTGAGFGQPTGVTANSSGVIWGSVVGAGVEFALSPNWTVGGEVLHTMYGDRNATILNPNGTSACNSSAPATNCTIRNQLTTDVARIRFNYRFGDTVVAKY